MFDTGGGITILSDALCKAMSCVPAGSFTGKRMSGQAITVKLSRIPSITIAGHTARDVRVAVLDTSSLLHPALGVDGGVGLDVLRDAAVTIDYANTNLVVEDAQSLAARKAAGTTVPVQIENDGPSTVVYLPLTIAPTLPPLAIEVDTGSRDLILNERFMTTLGIDKSATKKGRRRRRDRQRVHPLFLGPPTVAHYTERERGALTPCEP